jgi:hypothetical protein
MVNHNLNCQNALNHEGQMQCLKINQCGISKLPSTVNNEIFEELKQNIEGLKTYLEQNQQKLISAEV